MHTARLIVFAGRGGRVSHLLRQRRARRPVARLPGGRPLVGTRGGSDAMRRLARCCPTSSPTSRQAAPSTTEPCPTVSTTPAMSPKDESEDISTTTQPSLNNEVTINRYRVVYRRSDGRNAPGVDVPVCIRRRRDRDDSRRRIVDARLRAGAPCREGRSPRLFSCSSRAATRLRSSPRSRTLRSTAATRSATS